MISKLVISIIAGPFFLSIGPVIAAETVHTSTMRGLIVGADKSGSVVCIGTADGAEVGQWLKVYHIYNHVGPNKSSIPMYHRQVVGHVRIDHIFDEHFAHVRVTDGHPVTNDIVELYQK